MEDKSEIFNNAQSIAKILAQEIIEVGDIVVDATLGAGFDALFLAKAVGKRGKVFAFDVQEEAIKRAYKNLAGFAERVVLINDSHIRVDEYVEAGFKVAFFNLGYLPASNKKILTTAKTTLLAAEKSLFLLRDGGALFFIVYRGHLEGKEEWKVLKNFATNLEQNSYNVSILDFPNQRNNPPALITIQKRRK